MNSALRKVSIAVLVMFVALMVNANILQVGQAGSLKRKPENGRRLAERQGVRADLAGDRAPPCRMRPAR